MNSPLGQETVVALAAMVDLNWKGKFIFCLLECLNKQHVNIDRDCINNSLAQVKEHILMVKMNSSTTSEVKKSMIRKHLNALKKREKGTEYTAALEYRRSCLDVTYNDVLQYSKGIYCISPLFI